MHKDQIFIPFPFYILTESEAPRNKQLVITEIQWQSPILVYLFNRED